MPPYVQGAPRASRPLPFSLHLWGSLWVMDGDAQHWGHVGQRQQQGWVGDAGGSRRPEVMCGWWPALPGLWVPPEMVAALLVPLAPGSNLGLSVSCVPWSPWCPGSEVTIIPSHTRGRGSQRSSSLVGVGPFPCSWDPSRSETDSGLVGRQMNEHRTSGGRTSCPGECWQGRVREVSGRGGGVSRMRAIMTGLW